MSNRPKNKYKSPISRKIKHTQEEKVIDKDAEFQEREREPTPTAPIKRGGHFQHRAFPYGLH